jgi:hypothetical protein
MNGLVVFSHYILVILLIASLCNVYRKQNSAIFLNYFSYLAFFGIFYISLPSIITLSSETSLVGSSLQAIEFAATVGLYFQLIFLLSFWMSTRKQIHVLNYNGNAPDIINLFVKIGAIAISFYVMVLLAKDVNYLIEIYNNRRLQADYDYMLMSVFKIYFLSKVQIIFIAYLFFVTRKMKYLTFFIPFAVVDIVLSGRDLLFSFALLSILIYACDGRRINFKYLFLGVVILLSIGVLRANNVIEWSDILNITGEFMNTWATTHLIIDSSVVHSSIEAVAYSFFKLFPPGVFQLLFGDYTHYYNVITNDNPFPWGLSGSVVAETLSFKSNLMIFLVPILMALYGFVVNYLLKLNIVFSNIIFILSILYIHPIIRSNFFEHIFYPFYLVIFFGFWTILADVARFKKTKYST